MYIDFNIIKHLLITLKQQKFYYQRTYLSLVYISNHQYCSSEDIIYIIFAVLFPLFPVSQSFFIVKKMYKK